MRTSRPFDVSSLIKKEEPRPCESEVSPGPHTTLATPPPPLYPYLGLYHQLLHHQALPPGLPPGLSPLVMQAQLALAAQQNSLLASAYANLNSTGPGMERLKAARFSPYTRSAFTSVGSRAQSPPHPVKTISPPCLSPEHSLPSLPSSPSGIKNIQDMVNGLNGGPETKFGLTHSHDNRRELTQSQ